MKPGCSVAFLLGVPRSGTTLLSLLLNQHEAIDCPPEPWLLLGLDALGQVPVPHAADAALIVGALSEFLGDSRIRALRAAADSIYQQRLDASGKTVFIDKTPRYYHCLDLVEGFLPEARVILLLRNPLDVAASYRDSWNVDFPKLIVEQGDSPALFDLILGYNRLITFAEKHPVLRVHYEDLVTSTSTEMERIFSYLGLSNRSLSMDLDKELGLYRNSEFGDRKILKTTSVHRHSIDRYKNVFSSSGIEVLLEALGKNLFSCLGYDSCYRELVNEFQINPPDRIALEWLSKLEQGTARRKAACENPAASVLLDARYSHLEQRLENIQKANNSLNQQLNQVQVAISQLNQQLAQVLSQSKKLDKNFFRLRLFSLLCWIFIKPLHSTAYLRHIMYQWLWRMAKGSDKAPLPAITLVTLLVEDRDWIEPALHSVMIQNYPNLEYIVIAQALAGNAIVRAQRIAENQSVPNPIDRVISVPNQTLVDTLHELLSTARGEIVGILSGDDALEAGALERLGKYFSAHSKVNVIGHAPVLLLNGLKFRGRYKAQDRAQSGDSRSAPIPHGLFFRHTSFVRLGGMRRELSIGAIEDLRFRLIAQSKPGMRLENLVCYRIDCSGLERLSNSVNPQSNCQTPDSSGMESASKTSIGKAGSILRSLFNWFDLKGLQRRSWFFRYDLRSIKRTGDNFISNGVPVPRSPIDAKPAELFLFSAVVPKHGKQQVQYVYLDTRHEIAINCNAGYFETSDSQTQTSKFELFETEDQTLGYKCSDSTLAELKCVVKDAGIDPDQDLFCLDAGCFDGSFLDRVREYTPWRSAGLEQNPQAVEYCLKKDHRVWHASIDSALEAIPQNLRFDLIFLNRVIERTPAPLSCLRRLRLLLEVGGIIVVSTANLDSREMDRLETQWPHWNLAHHRYLFSQKGLIALTRQAGLRPIKPKTFSNHQCPAIVPAENLSPATPKAAEAHHLVCSNNQAAGNGDSWFKSIRSRRLGYGDLLYMAMRDDSDD